MSFNKSKLNQSCRVSIRDNTEKYSYLKIYKSFFPNINLYWWETYCSGRFHDKKQFLD